MDSVSHSPVGANAPSFLAIDLGATSGRAVVGTLTGAHMRMHEVHRFRTPMYEERNHLYWDIDTLWQEVCVGVRRALDVAPTLTAISVDSWGVDYVALDQNGDPIARPFSYRDPRTVGRLADVFRVMHRLKVYALTGTQLLPFNTLSQIVADLADSPDDVRRTASRLLIADYFLYRLSGMQIAECTMASTTQLLDVARREWATPLIRAIGDQRSRYPKIVAPGTPLQSLRPDALPAVLQPSEAFSPMIVAGCSHDTAAAVAATPASDASTWAYISSGTWSLVGMELPRPIVTPAALESGFTNELGVAKTVRFLKNRTGLWVLEECMREWAERGEQPTWDMLHAEAVAARPARQVIDLNEPQFLERGRMIAKIHAACALRNISIPDSRGALVRLILESLAQSYRDVIDELESLTESTIEVVHIVGGGSRNQLLNQLTANACGRRVIVGPDEATVLGNLLVQAHAMGALPAGVTIREAARASATLTEFTPQRATSPQTATMSAN